MAVCSLCLNSAQKVRFNFLMDVEEEDVAEWTYNIITLNQTKKLCTKCCQDLRLIGGMLFKWRNRIQICMETASSSVGPCKTNTVLGQSVKQIMNIDKQFKLKPPRNGVATKPNVATKVFDKSQEEEEDEDEEEEEEEAPAAEIEQEEEDEEEDDEEDCQVVWTTDSTRSSTDTQERGEKSSVAPKEPETKLEPQLDAQPSKAPLIDPEAFKISIKNALEKSRSLDRKKKYTKKKREKSEKRFKCEECPREFVKKDSVKRHMRLVHGPDADDGQKRQCPYCKEYFLGLRMHIVAAHGVDPNEEKAPEKKFLCRHCPLMFSIRRRMEEHERIHTNERPYTCKICGTTFRLLDYLRNHMSLHTGEKKFKCSHCDRRFRMASNRTSHERAVHKTVQYPCPFECGKYFIRQILVTKHASKCPLNKTPVSSNHFEEY